VVLLLQRVTASSFTQRPATERRHLVVIKRSPVHFTAVSLLMSALALSACSLGSSDDATLGTAMVELQIANGASIASASYVITGPNSFSRSGPIDVSQSATIATTIGGIPAGAGYSIALNAASTDTSCTGSSMFTVAAHATTPVTVRLQCREQPHAGSVVVGGTLNLCPLVDGVSASPGEIFVGGAVDLSVTAHDSDTGPAPLAYAWTVSGGVLDDAHKQSPRFHCTGPGTVTVSVTVSDGDCADTGSATVVCDLAACDDANPCTTDTRNADGSCAHAPVADGTVCTGGNLRVKLLGINDFHGQLDQGKKVGTRPVGGADVLVSYLKAAQAGREAQTLIVHAGDHVGASPPDSALLQDEPSISVLNLLANPSCSVEDRMNPGCNIVGTAGNHEFDEGKVELLRLVNGGNFATGPFLEDPWRGAKFPYVSATVTNTSDGSTLLPPLVVKLVQGVPIAVIGAVLKQTPTIVTPTGVAGLTFLDEADAINSYIPGLKAAGIHTIVVTIHQGGFQTSYNGATNPTAALSSGPEILDIINRLDDEVDVVVSGHTHAFTNALIPNAHGKKILVTQAFSASTAYDDIDLLIDPATRDVVSKSAQIVTTFGDAGPGLTPDAQAAAITAAAFGRVAPLVTQVVGVATGSFTRTENAAGESTLGNLIADAQREAQGTVMSFMNPGGIRADLDAGDVLWGELFNIQPFGNTMVNMNLTGAQIKDVLEQQFVGAFGQTVQRILKISGFTYVWNPAAPAGSKIVSILVGGTTPINPATTYLITTNNFLATGGDGFTKFTGGTNQVGGPIDLDVLIDYVEHHTPVVPALTGRITQGM
jgi:5'-nucleotidase